MGGPYQFATKQFKLKGDRLSEDFRMPSEEIPPESEVEAKDYKKARTAIIKSLWTDMGIAAWKRKGEFEKIAYEDNSTRLRDRGGQIFEMTPDGKIKDPFKKPEIRVDSDEFVKKVQQGKIFVFPVGKKKPSQLRLVNGELRYSKPIDRIPEPQPPRAPRRPGLFARMMHGISKRFFKQTFENYDAAMNRYNAEMETYRPEAEKIRKLNEGVAKETQKRVDGNLYKVSMEEYMDSKEFLGKELVGIGNDLIKDYLEPQREAEEKARIEQEKTRIEQERAAEEKAFAAAKGPEFKPQLDKNMDTLNNYYGPNPKRIESFTSKTNNRGNNPYTKEDFDLLKPIDIQGIKVGGKQVTDEQFTALSVSATMREDIGGNILYSKEAKESKIPLKDWTMHNNTLCTSDLFMNKSEDGPKPREGVGEYFSVGVQPAREYAKKALDEYQQGNPEKLGGLIAEGIKSQVNLSRHVVLRESGGSQNYSNLTIDASVGKTMELLENDPKLMEEAKKAGVTDAELNALKGMREVADIARENERAETLLNLDAQSKHVKLNEQERKDCIQSRLRFEVVNEKIRKQIQKKERSEEFKQGQQALDEKMGNVAKESAMAGDNQKTMNNKIACVMAEMSVFRAKQIGVPKAFERVGERGLKEADRLTKKYLPGKDKLQNLQGKDLQDALKPAKLFGEKSPYREAPVTEARREQTINKAPVTEAPQEQTIRRRRTEPVQKGNIQTGGITF